MIFVTVGTQLPFPRLISAMDNLALELGETIVAQTGSHENVTHNLDCYENFTPIEYDRHFSKARVVVAHAGIGSILSAKQRSKPLVLLPRRADLGEHRNDHQYATAKGVEHLKGIYVAWEVNDLLDILRRTDLESASNVMSGTREALLERLRTFIQS